MTNKIKLPFPWRLFWAELIGTALLLLIGLSLVILMLGSDSRAKRITVAKLTISIDRDGLLRKVATD